MKNKYRKILIVAIAIYASACANTNFKVNPDAPQPFHGTVETREIKIGSRVGGRVTEVLVEEGNSVEINQPLVRFDVAELHSQLKQSEARVAQQRARLDQLIRGFRVEEIAQASAVTGTAKASFEVMRNGARPEDIAQVKASVAAIEAEVASAKISYERFNLLHQSGDLSRHEVDSAKYRYEAISARRDAEMKKMEVVINGNRHEEIQGASERLRQAEQAEKMIRVGARPEEIADARAQLAEAQAKVEQFKVLIAEGELHAPAHARVEAISIRPGDVITADQSVMKLLEADQLFVRMFIPEPDLAKIKIGQQVNVKIDAADEQVLIGIIEQINEQGEFTPRNVQSRDERNHQVFGVKIKLNNSAGNLKAGMAVSVNLQ
jgi:HlyD family secretion protein